MTEPDKHLTRLQNRVAELERQRKTDLRVGGFARAYLAFAALLVALSVMPLYESEARRDPGSTATTLREYAALASMEHQRSWLYLVALGALGCLVVTLGIATFQDMESPVVPWFMAAMSVITIVVLIAKPGMGVDPPPLSGAGTAEVVLLVGVIAISLSHASVLRQLRKEGGPRR